MKDELLPSFTLTVHVPYRIVISVMHSFFFYPQAVLVVIDVIIALLTVDSQVAQPSFTVTLNRSNNIATVKSCLVLYLC